MKRFLPVLMLAALTSCTSTTITTSANSPHVTGSSSSSAKPPGAAHLGDTITLTGQSGEQLDVRLVKVIDPATPANSFLGPDKGNVFASIVFRFTNSGSKAYSDSPPNMVQIVDTSGVQYDAVIDPVKDCQSSSDLKISPSDFRAACVVFQVPKAAKIHEVLVTLDSGFADQTGQWTVG